MPGTTDHLWADAYRIAARIARRAPASVANDLPAVLGPVFAAAMPGRRRMSARHMRRVHGTSMTRPARRRAVNDAFESYARYWIESFRLPQVSPDDLDRHMDVPGFEHVQAGLEAGRGVILALPHLGGWEWAGFWVTRVRGVRLSVVVEPIEPPELFDWFREFREQLGMQVLPLGRDVGSQVSAALGRNEVVCLLCDRDIGGAGVPVTFFGETTTLPGGPATLGLRSGAPVLPTAVYFRGRAGHLGHVRPGLDLTRRGPRLRDDVTRVTQDLAAELETLIRRAPEQWHLFQPNWPSDHEWVLRQRSERRFRPGAPHR